MRTRLRGPGGASTLTFDNDATVADLISQIADKTSVANFDVKYGYPPRPFLLDQYPTTQRLSTLDINLDGEQLTISQKDDTHANQARDSAAQTATAIPVGTIPIQKAISSSNAPAEKPRSEQLKKPVSLTRKDMDGDVPEVPLPDRGSTLVLRVMPDDNSCLFRAFAAAVLPGDDLSMPELRALVATKIQEEPEVYTKVVLEQEPDDYCRWIQTADAWGGAIEMGIMSNHFDVEICSIDVQSLRIDRFNSNAPRRLILVYSGIHYDTIVQSPSEPPHTKADSPPELDNRLWDINDDDILEKAIELCRGLQKKHYFTDTGGMAIKCNECGVVVYGQGQASGHAMQTGHYDMAEIHASK